MKKLTIFTRGIAKENPGPAAIGVFVVDSRDEVVLELSEAIGNATNDYAEYFAVVRGFQALAEKLGNQTRKIDFELKLESELVKDHLSAEAQIKDVSLIGHFVEIYNLRVANFPILKLTLINSNENKEAVGLAEQALDE